MTSTLDTEPAGTPPAPPPVDAPPDDDPRFGPVDAVLSGGEVVPPADPVEDILGPDCPVRPLGYEKQKYWFIDTLGRCYAFGVRDFTPSGLLSMFGGDPTWLQVNCKADRKGTMFDALMASSKLIRACAVRGLFNPNMIRGPGVWPPGSAPGAAAGLVLNLGDALAFLPPGKGWADCEWHRLGSRIGSFIYVSGDATFHPASDPDTDTAIAAVRDVLQRLPWKEPEKSVQVMLGALGLGYLCGAAPFRTIVGIEADLGSGKSQPMELFADLLGQNGKRYENVTFSKINTYLRDRNGASCFLLDEFEEQTKERGQGKSRTEQIVELFRYTFTWGQGTIGRDGAGAFSMTAHASAIMAAIQLPNFRAADASRSVRLRLVKSKLLEKLREDSGQAAAFDAAKRKAEQFGPDLYRLALDRFSDFDAVFAAYRHAILVNNGETRDADTYGSILAFAHLLTESTNDKLAEKAAYWAKYFTKDAIGYGVDVAPSSERCWRRLLSTPLRTSWTGGSNPTPRALINAVHGTETEAHIKRNAKETLNELGITFMRPSKQPPPGSVIVPGKEYVAIANNMDGVKGIFDGSEWANGGHARVLVELPGAYATKHAVNSLPERDRAVCVPLDMVSVANIHDESFADEVAEGWQDPPPADDPDEVPF